MKRAWRNSAAFCGLAVCLYIGASSVPSYGADCVPVVIGLDPSQANGSGGAVLGHGVGQTFAARDTLILSLTVWQVETYNTIGMHLYIVGTDSTGRPDATKIIQDGPTLNIYDGTYPVEFKWTFDPPVALPSPGEYAFFLFQDPCAIYFDILATSPSLYPEGQAWGTGRSDCVMNGDLHTNPAGDDIFQIEFCHDTVTPTRKASWGRLKTIYR